MGDKLRARLDAQSKALRLAQKQAEEDMLYGLPGWSRAVHEEPRPMFLNRVVERRVSSGHKVIYRLEYARG